MTNPIIVHKESRNIYQLNENGTYTNLTTGNTGELTAENAKDKFVFPVTANDLIQRNPLVLDLLTKLQLTLEK